MVTKQDARAMLEILDIADEALNLVRVAEILAKVPDTVKVDKSDKRVKSVKVDKPRKGDMVGEYDGNGQLVRTWYVSRKPAAFVILRADGTNRPWVVNLDKFTRIAKNVWFVMSPTFQGDLYQIPA
jgi:hypothetical protein